MDNRVFGAYVLKEYAQIRAAKDDDRHETGNQFIKRK